jgi:hypothetical protein
MDLTIDEIIDRIKYHGHQYGLSTIEILEEIKKNHENEIDNEIERVITETIEEQEEIFNRKLTEIMKDEELTKEEMKAEIQKFLDYL